MDFKYKLCFSSVHSVAIDPLAWDSCGVILLIRTLIYTLTKGIERCRGIHICNYKNLYSKYWNLSCDPISICVWQFKHFNFQAETISACNTWNHPFLNLIRFEQCISHPSFQNITLETLKWGESTSYSWIK